MWIILFVFILLGVGLFIMLDSRYKWVFFKPKPPAWEDAVIGMPNLMSLNQVGVLSAEGVKNVYIDNEQSVDTKMERNMGLDAGYRALMNSIQGLGFTRNVAAGDFYCVWVESTFPDSQGVPRLKILIDSSSEWWGTRFHKTDPETGENFILTADLVLGLLDRKTPFPMAFLPGGSSAIEHIRDNFRAAGDHIIAEYNDRDYHIYKLMNHTHFFYPKASGASLAAPAEQESDVICGGILLLDKEEASKIPIVENFS